MPPRNRFLISLCLLAANTDSNNRAPYRPYRDHLRVRPNKLKAFIGSKKRFRAMKNDNAPR